MTHRKILLGALAGAAALAAIPSAANAAATCTYDQTAHKMAVRYGASDTSVTVRDDSSLRYSEAGGFLRSCFSPTGVVATAGNTNTLEIRVASGFGGNAQSTVIDETGGKFDSSNRLLEIHVLTGTSDRLTIREGANNDSVRLAEQTGLGFGPAIDLNADGHVDVKMTTDDSVVEVDGGGGNDTLDASPALSYGTVLVGQTGNDVLIGGAKKADILDGGPNDDFLFAKDGISETIIGGTGTDHAQLDFADQPDGVEIPS
jgi:hypothetical protein